MASEKRQLEEADDNETAAKRGRGRPLKDPSAPPPPPRDPNAPKRGRGRPRKNPDELAKPKSPKVPGRGRGRPRKNPDAPVTPKPPKVPGRGRGRPRKDANSSTNHADASISANSSAAAKRSVMKLSQLIGTYELDCEEVEQHWPDLTGEMSLSISALPHTKTYLIASFNLGILEGTMLLANSKDAVERANGELDDEDSAEEEEKKPDQSVDPTLKNATIYYTWRGRDIGETDEVHTGSDGSQTGVINLAPGLASFSSLIGGVPTLKDMCKFIGKRSSDEPEETPEPWTAFLEEANNKANE